MYEQMTIVMMYEQMAVNGNEFPVMLIACV